ncbi:MAG: hypothetical protein L0154_23760 [Chloroflexi bacterium]|nr:hypothetical protein [Chloroflexota bacterium]
MSLKRQLKPTIDTKFHIDYAWWGNQERELDVYLMSFLPESRRKFIEEQSELEVVDSIDPLTAEVTQVNPFEQAIRETHEEIDLTRTSLVDAVFRVFLMNNNTPLNAKELSKIIDRPPQTILRTIGSPNRIYRGIRVYAEEDE